MFVYTRAVCLVVFVVTVAVASKGFAEPGMLMLRVAPSAISSESQQLFEREQEVNDLVLGTKIHGKAKTTGKVSVASCDARESHGLKIVVAGVSVTKSEGRNGPAIIHSTTTTDFIASTPLQFDPKVGIVAGEIDVAAETITETDGIQSTQRGIAGAIVKKLAAKKIAESREETATIARDLAVTRIRGEVQAELTNRLAELNRCYVSLLPILQEMNAEATPVRLEKCDGELLICVGGYRDRHRSSLPRLRGAADLILLAGDQNDMSLTQKLAAMTMPVSTLNAGAGTAKAMPRLAQEQQWLIVRVGDDGSTVSER